MQQRILPDIIKNPMVHAIAEDNTLRDAAKLMADKKIGALVVLKGGQLTGIVTERDLIVKAAAKGLDFDQAKIGQVMTAKLQTLKPDSTAGEALERMQTGGFRHMPVVDGTNVVAMVSVRDIYDAVRRQLESELQSCVAYVAGESYGTGS
jgi:CBS domain-containing protein